MASPPPTLGQPGQQPAPAVPSAFEQQVLRAKLTIHEAVTLPQRIQITPMPGTPAGPVPDQPPQQPGQQPGQQPQQGAQPGGLSPQQVMPPTNPQDMLQQLQQRYSQQPQQAPQPQPAGQ